MFTKALVGIDRSPAESALLSCLPDLASWGVGSVTLAHVIRVGYVEGAGYGHEEAYRSWLENSAKPIRDAGLAVEVSVSASGAPEDGLLAVAGAEAADLVVVGSRSHSFVHEIFLGSVAKEVIRKSDLPVLLERLEPTQAGRTETCAAVCGRTLERVLLATDLSERSRSAEEAAMHLAPRAGHIDCLTVLPHGATEDDCEAVRAKHQGLIRRMKGGDAKAGSRVEQGDASEVIAHVGRDGYSLIIVGKHGQDWLAGKIIGSTAASVCEIARRPVLMVPTRKA